MSWVLRKLDSLGGAVMAAAGGMVLSQAPAFFVQYLQRLGGHLDEARMAVTSAGTLPGAPGAPPPEALDVLTARLQARVDHLAQVYQAVSDAGPWTRPFAFLRHADWAIVDKTLEHFQPALPLTGAGLSYLALGLVLGLVAFELVKLPFALAGGRPHRKRRLFDTHGGS